MTTPCTQGAAANHTGRAFEARTEALLLDLGIEFASRISVRNYLTNPDQAPSAFFTKEYPFILLDGTAGKTEFVIWIKDAVGTPEFSSEGKGLFTQIRVEDKFQGVSGTAEDKLRTTLFRLAEILNEKRAIMAVDLPGCTLNTRISLIRTCREIVMTNPRGGKEIAVMGLDGLREQILIMLGRIPVPNREATNDRSKRDVFSPEADAAEHARQEYFRLVHARITPATKEDALPLAVSLPVTPKKVDASEVTQFSLAI